MMRSSIVGWSIGIGIVVFNVQIDTLQVISETILQVT